MVQNNFFIPPFAKTIFFAYNIFSNETRTISMSHKKKLRELFWTGLSIVFGNALLAFVVEAFIIPHGIIMGGTTGIAIVLNRLISVDTATIVLVLNTVLLIAGGIVLGRKLVTTTLASTFLYPLFMGLIQRIPGIESVTDNALMASLFGGVLMGVALGVVMRVGSSTGGMDIASLIMSKWTHIPVSICVYIADALVIGGQALFSTSEPILYGLVVLVLESFALDRVMILGLAQIQLFVVSQHFEDIRRRLLDELDAGVTMIEMETGHLGLRQKGVMCVIPHRKLYNATEMIQAIDPAAFITITQVKEVRGRGFTLDQLDVRPVNEDNIM